MMLAKSISTKYICPNCKSERLFYRFSADIDSLRVDHESCKMCAAKKIIAILDILYVECTIRERQC